MPLILVSVQYLKVTIGELHSYKALNATPKKVIEKLVKNEDMSAAESRVFKFHVTFVGDLNPEELRNFLRYVTGSSVLICERIKVTFNSISGLGRSPVWHTCDCWLELSTTYYTYPEFKHEFLNILNSAVAWPMDAGSIECTTHKCDNSLRQDSNSVSFVK